MLDLSPDITSDVAPVVLVRAFDGRPLKRIAVDQKSDVLYIANPKSRDEVATGRCKPIGFRRSQCFTWNIEAFERLARQYAATGSTTPEDWNALTPFRERLA